jgi:hypothetical protein
LQRVDTIARVRRAFHVRGWSVKTIMRALHVSRREARAATGSRPRRTVREILRSDETDFSYERERQPMPRIGPWRGQPEQLLSVNAGACLGLGRASVSPSVRDRWRGGQVEDQVGLVRERFFTPRLRVKSLDEPNAWLMDKCVAYAQAHRHREQAGKTIWEMFEAERLHLVPCAGPFDGFHSVPAARPLSSDQWLTRSRCRRPARCGSTTTGIPFWPRRSGGLSICTLMRTGSSSRKMG